MKVSSKVGAAARIKGIAFAGVAVAAPLCLTAVGQAAVKSWSAGNGNWTTGANWSPAGAPAAGDTIMIGPHAGAANSVVSLNADGDIDSLTLNDGMTLRTLNSFLDVDGTTQISGQNVVGPTTYASRLRVENGVAGFDFRTNNLTLSNFGQATLEDNASMVINGVATIGGDALLSGHGSISFGRDGSPALVNNGRLEATAGGLTLYQAGTGRLDLDGTSVSSSIAITSGGGDGLIVYGDQLADIFSGDVEMSSNSLWEMNLTNGWAADLSSSLTVTGSGDLPAAIVDGAPIDWAGDVTVTGNHGRLRFAADVTIDPEAVFHVNGEDELEFTGVTEIEGGDFNLANGAELRFLNDTFISGGTFSTSGVAANSGRVSFLGPSNWQGNVTLSGRSRVNGMGIVSAATTITADQFDMDGGAGVTLWDVNAALTVNADQIDETGNSFDGAIDINGGPASRLAVNLTNPADTWRMMGTMNLTGISGLYYTRVSGSRMEVGGTLNISDANINIAADMTLLDGGELNLAAAGSDLRLSGASTFKSGASITGQGLLHNNNSVGGMTIGNGVTLGQAGLVNGGRLFIGDNGPGQVAVDRFVSDADATLQMVVGGTTPGIELSHLLVTGGTAQLDGTLAISLAAEGDWTFAPELGDQFTILTAPGGVVGQFDNLLQPAGLPTGLLFEVQYTPTSVVLFVDDTFAADFDRDGDVDSADLPVWNSAYGVTNGGDATSDSVSDGADFLVWQRQYGSGLPVAMAFAVPEPSTAALLVCGGLFVVRAARRVRAPALRFAAAVEGQQGSRRESENHRG